MTDTRAEYKDVMWQQGKDNEGNMAFAFFSEADKGKSRVLVYVYETQEECTAAIEDHNVGARYRAAKWLLGEE